MKVCVLFSGGKDSTYATWIVQHQAWEVASLLTLRPRSSDSLIFHYPNVEWTRLQAEAMGLRHEMVEATSEDELSDLRLTVIRLKTRRNVTGLVAGAVSSDYQKTRFENMCDGIGVKTYVPLWHKSPTRLEDDLKKAGFRILITAVAASGLDKSWLGRELTDQEWSRLERLSQTHGINLAGEGGEYESFVLDAPHFRKTIRVEKCRKEWKGDSGRLVIEAASLRDKLSD